MDVTSEVLKCAALMSLLLWFYYGHLATTFYKNAKLSVFSIQVPAAHILSCAVIVRFGSVEWTMQCFFFAIDTFLK